MSNIATRCMNDEALRTAIRAFAPQQAEGIEFLYVLLDDAMKKGHAIGLVEGNEAAQGDNEIERDIAWDHGYLQGVSDARARPAKADDIVQDILADLEGEAFAVEDAAPDEGEAKDNAHPEGEEWGPYFTKEDVDLQEAWLAYDRQVFRD